MYKLEDTTDALKQLNLQLNNLRCSRPKRDEKDLVEEALGQTVLLLFKCPYLSNTSAT